MLGFRVPSLAWGLTGLLMDFVHGQMVGGSWSNDWRQYTLMHLLLGEIGYRHTIAICSVDEID